MTGLQPPAPLGRHARRPAPDRRHPAHPLLRPRPRHTPGATSKVLYVCVMEDVLVRTHGTWRTAHRRITRDDLA